MRKAAVRDGDSTTTRGFVIGTSTRINDGGKKVALDGDGATCGNCEGVYKIVGTGKGISDTGRNVVVDGDLVLCPCKKNRVIVGSNPKIFLNSTDGSAAASNAATTMQAAIATIASVKTYDEQVRAVALGVALEGYPYFIQTASGKAHAGRSNVRGHLPRIHTDSSDDYTVHWGDDALARLSEA